MFQVTDSFGNIISSEPVNFRLENANGDIIDNGLTEISDISNDEAFVNTRVNNILTQEGIYSVVANLPDNVENTGTATIEILPSLPNLPALGFSSIFNIDGTLSNSTARFYGGISVNGGTFAQEVVKKFSSEDEIVIRGAITTDENHIDESYDILVIAGYKIDPFGTEEAFFVLDSVGTPQPWKVMDMENLLTFKEDVALFRNSVVEMYRGTFAFTGLIRVFFAYRLSNGAIIFNSNLAISLLLEE